MEIRGTITRIGFMVGAFKFPQVALKLLLIGPFELSWDKRDRVASATQPSGFWFWSPGRVWLLQTMRAPDIRALGVSLQLWDSWGISLHVGTFATRLEWQPAHRDIGPRLTMREQRQARGLADLLHTLFGEKADSVRINTGSPDFRNHRNLN